MLTISKTVEIANVKWTAAQITTFLELLRKHECLWRITDKDRKSKHYREAAFENLLVEVQELVGPSDLDMDTMKRKMKNLKTVYSRELAKVLKSEKDGETYVPSLRWYTVADSFLRHSKEADEVTLSTDDIQELLRNELNQGSLSDVDCEVVESVDASHCHSNDPSDIHFEDSSSAIAIKDKLSSSKLTQSSNSPCNFSRDLSSQNSVKRKLDNGSVERTKTSRGNLDPQDQFVAFGLYVAAELRQLSDETQLKLAKHYINSILFDASMSALLPP